NAAERQAAGTSNRQFREVGGDGRARPAHGRQQQDQDERDQLRRSAQTLGVSANPIARFAESEKSELGQRAAGPICSAQVGSQGTDAICAGRPAYAHSSCLPRSYWLAADVRRSGGIRPESRSQGV